MELQIDEYIPTPAEQRERHIQRQKRLQGAAAKLVEKRTAKLVDKKSDHAKNELIYAVRELPLVFIKLTTNTHEIAIAVSRASGFTVEEIRSPRRRKELVVARQLVCFLARELTSASFPQIGKYLGGRDHSTVLSGNRATKERARQHNEWSEMLRYFFGATMDIMNLPVERQNELNAKLYGEKNVKN